MFGIDAFTYNAEWLKSASNSGYVMMGCKEDDTCDQPTTKGEIELLTTIATFTLIWVLVNHLMWYSVKN